MTDWVETRLTTRCCFFYYKVETLSHFILFIFPKQNPISSSSPAMEVIEFDAATNIFLYAAHLGNLKRLEESAAALDRLLGVGIPVIIRSAEDRKGRTAVHYAASGGRINVLRYLIEEMEVDVDDKDRLGRTPLSCAAIDGHLAAVKYLLQMDADPEIQDDLHFSPLHHVAVKGHSNIIPLLLSKGINVNVEDDFGSPLQYAAAAGKLDTVKVLLDHGANPNLVFHGIFTPLQASILSQSWQCVEQLLKAGANPNGGPDGVKALLMAAAPGESASIEEQVESSADSKVTNIPSGATQIIKLLVEAGADPNVTNIYRLKPIEIAAINGNLPGVEVLFPVTSPISSYVDWSTNGIMKHANSKEFKEKIYCKEAEENFLEAKSRGASALQRKEYWLAEHWYTEALDMKPDDAAVLSNRSMCFAYFNRGDLALEDANKCILQRPDWPKAYYRRGVALRLLNRLGDAADAFFYGLKLDPKSKELENAFRDVSLARLKAINVPL